MSKKIKSIFTIILFFISGNIWSSEPLLNNGYPVNTYQQNYYNQAYNQAYYQVPAYPVQNQYGYYAPPTYQAPEQYGSSYVPEYNYPVYQNAYAYPYYSQPETIKKTISISEKTIPEVQLNTSLKSRPHKTVPNTIKNKNKLTYSQRKKQFLSRVLPLVINENRQIQKNRTRLLAILSQYQQKSLPAEEKYWLKLLAKKYRITGDIHNTKNLQQDLLKRVNGISPAMALAQAANESAWGTSRFSKEGNNLFGIWTYNEKIGIKPLNRAPGKKHFVRKFTSYKESVIVYMHTLNTHAAYAKLRDIRHLANINGEKLSGHDLARGLEKYSERGQEYIKDIQAMIKHNQLEQLHIKSLTLNVYKLKKEPVSEIASN